MATLSCSLAWRIPMDREPGGLQFIGSQRVGHDLATKQEEEDATWREAVTPRSTCFPFRSAAFMPETETLTAPVN